MKPGKARLPGQARVTPRGASPRAQDKPGAGRRLWELLMGPGGKGLIWALLLVAAGYGLRAPVLDWLARPVSGISVEGDFEHLRRTRVEAVLSEQVNAPFLQLDLARIKAALEAEPWVERASVRRRWPDRLHVRVHEQQPIARWNDSGFLNRYGEIIELEDGRVLSGLPELQANDRDAARMMERYLELTQILRSTGLHIKALHKEPTGSWRLQVSDGTWVVMGRDRILEKAQDFVRVFHRHLKESWTRVDQVDLRYANGLAVAWEENAQGKQSSTDSGAK